MFTDIVKYSTLMLQLLYESFQSQKITYEEFKLHTEIKTVFLKENINNIISEEERNAVQDILNKCNSVSSTVLN